MKRRKSKFRIIVSVLIWITLLSFAAIIFIPGWPPYKHHVIVTGSMAPEIEVGAWVVVKTDIDYDTLEEGDIISFFAEVSETAGRQIVLHHIHEIHYDPNGERSFTTIAAHTEVPDNWVVYDADIVGQYRFHFNGVGRVVLFLQSSVGRILIIVNLVVILLLGVLFKGREKQSGFGD